MNTNLSSISAKVMTAGEDWFDDVVADGYVFRDLFLAAAIIGHWLSQPQLIDAAAVGEAVDD